MPSHLKRSPRLSARVLPAALALALASPAAFADPQSAVPLAASDVDAKLTALTAKIDAQDAEIARLRAQVEELQLQQLRGRGVAGEGGPQTAVPPPVDTARIAREKSTTQPQQADPNLQVGQTQRDEDEARRQQEKTLVVREHAPLFERKFTLDAGMSYSYYDRRALTLSGFLALDAIFLGTINIDQNKASIATLDVTGRYGITDRFSLEADLPWVARETRFVSGGAGGAASSLTETNVRATGIGDVSAAAYYQLVKESATHPDVVASLRVRAPTGHDPFGLKVIQADGNNSNLNVPETLPTGTGVWSATGNVSVLRTYDPVILFGNIGYTWNRPESFDDISPVVGSVQPAEVFLGHMFNLSGGVAIALNDRAAISLSVASAMQAATHTRAPESKSVRIPGSSSNATTLNIGTSYVLPSGWTLNGQLAAGLTPDAPNFVFSLRGSRAF
ncbi:transporter [Cognatilysobacter terrigena]|uniref:transporter n=1 Tax=Cognatilysobacter terrigena TaxID=2488749 RepID=UPI001061FA4A|nr:transporter [Lysobacter terrigena]